MQNDLNYAVELLQQADGLLITAGAGMSTDSGLPDFRSEEGFWKAYPKLKQYKLNFENITTPEAFNSYRQLAYGFYGHRLNQYRHTEPHQGYYILKKWAETKPNGYFVFTSNVDGHFQKAGFEETRVYEVHGSLERMQCMQNCTDQSWEATSYHPVIDNQQLSLINSIPRCPYCGGLTRPNILMFNDHAYSSTYQDKKYDDLILWLSSVKNLLVIELGAGVAVPTVRIFSEFMVYRYQAKHIRINFQATEIASSQVTLRMRALDALIKLN